MKHTRTPWAVSVMNPPKASHYIYNIPGVICMEVDKQASTEEHEQARVDIDFIAKACNEHDEITTVMNTVLYKVCSWLLGKR